MNSFKPIKIALLGAPGSGKSKIARKTVSLLKPETDWTIIDGYVNNMSKQTGIDFGPSSNFAQNLSIITSRWIKEAEAYKKQYNTITCGTIYESIIYSTFNTIFSSPDESAIIKENYINQILMQALGALELSTYDYDAMFLLRLNEQKLKENKHTWIQVVDAKLLDALEGFNKKIIILDEKTDTEKAKTVVEVIGKINEYYKTLASENVEQTI